MVPVARTASWIQPLRLPTLPRLNRPPPPRLNRPLPHQLNRPLPPQLNRLPATQPMQLLACPQTKHLQHRQILHNQTQLQ